MTSSAIGVDGKTWDRGIIFSCSPRGIRVSVTELHWSSSMIRLSLTSAFSETEVFSEKEGFHSPLTPMEKILIFMVSYLDNYSSISTVVPRANTASALG